MLGCLLVRQINYLEVEMGNKIDRKSHEVLKDMGRVLEQIHQNAEALLGKGELYRNNIPTRNYSIKNREDLNDLRARVLGGHFRYTEDKLPNTIDLEKHVKELTHKIAKHMRSLGDKDKVLFLSSVMAGFVELKNKHCKLSNPMQNDNSSKVVSAALELIVADIKKPIQEQVGINIKRDLKAKPWNKRGLLKEYANVIKGVPLIFSIFTKRSSMKEYNKNTDSNKHTDSKKFKK